MNGKDFEFKRFKKKKNIKHLIINNILKLRKSNNFTQRELAKKINITDVTLSSIERKRFFPRFKFFINMAKALDVSIYDIVEVSIDLIPLEEQINFWENKAAHPKIIKEHKKIIENIVNRLKNSRL